MKIVKYEVAGHLNQLETGPEAQVGDQVKLFLDQVGRPDLPEFIFATIQPPIKRIKCDEWTQYSFEYDENDIPDGLIRPDDIVSVEVTAAVDVVAADLQDEIERATAAEGVLTANLAAEVTARIADVNAEEARALAAEALLAPKASPVFTGNPTAPTPSTSDNDTSLATTAFVQAQPVVRYDVQGLSGPQQEQARANIGMAAYKLSDSAGEISVDWDARQLVDAGGTISSIDWGGRTLIDPAGNLVVDWSVPQSLSIGDNTNFILSTITGTRIGTATSQKLAFHNSLPVIQRASASQAAVVTTASTQTTPWGFATQAQADALVTLVNELRAALVEKGLIKGSV